MHFQGLLGGQLVGLDMRLVWLAHFLPLPCNQTLPWPCHPLSRPEWTEDPHSPLSAALPSRGPVGAEPDGGALVGEHPSAAFAACLRIPEESWHG